MALGDSNANGMIMPVAPTGGFGNNGMGRYSSTGDFRMELEEIMQDAPNEAVRQKLMETMNIM